MRLGGSYVPKYANAEEWVAACKKMRYSAAVAPIDFTAPGDERARYAQAAAKADIVIAEVGAWSNPISPDTEKRRSAVAYCQNQLALAEELGALCCVNISGSTGTQWDGPDPGNYRADTYTLIVDTVRSIIDAVGPKRTFYTLETMPWAYPDTADSYEQLLRDIDRPAFAVHLDIVNMINSPRLCLYNEQYIAEVFKKLGPHIKSCHAKDVVLAANLTTHISEAAPGKGMLRYPAFLRAVESLGADMPLIIEHMTEEQDYVDAVDFIASVAKDNNITIK